MNVVVLIGRLAREPELRYTQSQTAVCSMTIAVDRPYRKDRQEGTQTADFLRVNAWGKMAENCTRYLAKGRQVAVKGRIQTGSYTDKNGNKVFTTDIVAENVEFIGSAPKNQQNSQNQQRNNPPAAYPQEPGDIPEGFEFVDEGEIPF